MLLGAIVLSEQLTPGVLVGGACRVRRLVIGSEARADPVIGPTEPACDALPLRAKIRGEREQQVVGRRARRW